ncbi:MAG: hypothetical protein HY507_00720 [Candidatus Zambryskibacteria bacterium]|nr:hypothetical protein [Candidatus Zambryskibacteria bacterium]
MGILAQRISEHDAQVTIDLLSHFFLSCDEFTDPEIFSVRVEEICDNLSLNQTQKISILAATVRRYPDLLTAEVAKKYFERVENNPDLLRKLFGKFEELPTTVGPYRPLSKFSREVRIVRTLLKVMKITAPDDRRAFAKLALRKLPNLPGRDRGKSHWLLKHLESIAFGRCLLVDDVTTQTTQSSVSKKPEQKTTSVVLERFVIPGQEELEKLPRTKQNLRKWRKQIVQSHLLEAVGK